ncbi:unnamed protein product [Closterium sp. NIES-54]
MWRQQLWQQQYPQQQQWHQQRWPQQQQRLRQPPPWGLLGPGQYKHRPLRHAPAEPCGLVTPISLWTGSLGVAADYRVCCTSPHNHLPRIVQSLSCLGVREGAATEGGGTEGARPGGASSGGAGGVKVETFPVEDTSVSTRRPSPTSPFGFPSIPQFPRLSLQPAVAEPGGVHAGGTGDTGGVVAGGSSSRGAEAGDTGIATPTPRNPRRSRYGANGPFHLVLHSGVPPPPVLLQPPESSLNVFRDPLSDYLRASRPIVSRVLFALVTHLTAPPLSVSELVTTVSAFASSHHLDYATHLMNEAACSPSSRGAIIFPLEALYWIAGEEAEMASHSSTSTYVDAVPPSRANVLSGMWLYEVKRRPGAPLVFHARYVARGFSQREGVDFVQTFALTSKMTTLQVLPHIAAQRDYELHSSDFSAAFLQGSRSALVFFPLSADPSLFVRFGSAQFFVLVYVDDLVFAKPDRHALASVKEELLRRHTCTDLGELQCYLGLQITRDRAPCTITLTQLHMVKQILTRFRFPFSKVQLTLVAMDHGLTAPPSDKSFESSGPYPELVGCRIQFITFPIPASIAVTSLILCTDPSLPPFYVIVYDDNSVFATADTEALSLVKAELQKRHNYINLGELLNCLGLQITRDRAASTITLTQSHMVQQVMTRFHFWISSPQPTPLPMNHSPSAPPSNECVEPRGPYPELVGCLICEAKIYAGDMAAQELRWLTYLLTDLGE